MAGQRIPRGAHISSPLHRRRAPQPAHAGARPALQCLIVSWMFLVLLRSLLTRRCVQRAFEKSSHQPRTQVPERELGSPCKYNTINIACIFCLQVTDVPAAGAWHTARGKKVVASKTGATATLPAQSAGHRAMRGVRTSTRPRQVVNYRWAGWWPLYCTVLRAAAHCESRTGGCAHSTQRCNGYRW